MQKICFKENIISSFKNLWEDKELSDVTLVCEDGQQIVAHKIVISSSNPFFMELLKKNKAPSTSQIHEGLRSDHLEATRTFSVYFGEANVLQENIDAFFALAE